MDINVIFWYALFVVLIFVIFKKNGTKKHKRIVGTGLIFLGAAILLPIPDPTDAIGFPIFSVLKGIKVSMDNFIMYFVEYSILSFIFGAILIWVGASIAGLKPTYLIRKIKRIFKR